MRVRALLRHRPSPAIAISSVALFMSLGGVGYAATQLPHNSVGAYQLRNNSVNYKKIVPGSVGLVRANLGQLQERVSGSCPTASAIATVDQSGKVSCNPTLPAEFGTTNNTSALTTAPATVSSITLPAGASYLAFANPTVTVASGATATHTSVSCTLTVGSDTETRTATLNPSTTAGQSESVSIPLQAAGGSGPGSVTCTSTAPATAVAAINAIQTSNNS
jgi:hypothetical protein